MSMTAAYASIARSFRALPTGPLAKVDLDAAPFPTIDGRSRRVPCREPDECDRSIRKDSSPAESMNPLVVRTAGRGRPPQRHAARSPKLQERDRPQSERV